MNEPRVYKNSPAALLLIAVFFIILIASIMVSAVIDPIVMILVCGFGLLSFLIVFLSVSSKVIISDDEITSQNILSKRTLRWTEIIRVSGRVNGIKLHSEDTTVSINPQLPGYEEVVEIIGQKRADIFSTQEFNEFRRGFASYFGFLLILLVFAVIGFFYFSLGDFSFDSLMPMGFIALFLLIFTWIFLASPQSMMIENNNLQIKYLLGEKNLLANDVAGIFLTYTRSRRGGKRYYIAITTRDNKQTRISNMNVGLPVIYLVLKNWHKKYALKR